MAGTFQPLVENQKIVTDDGRPTEYFIRFIQQKQNDIGTAVTEAEAETIAIAEIDAWAAARDINAGVGLSGGGNLSVDRTINLEDTAVTPDTYGDATNVPQITVDQQGRITAVTDVAISGGGGSGYPEATSFPGSPTTGDKLYRTDRNILYFYDGTRWLTVDEKLIVFPVTGVTLSASNQFGRISNPEYNRYGGLYLTQISYLFQVTGTGTWTLELYSYEGNTPTVIISEASSTTGGVRVGATEAVNSVVANTVESIELAAIENSGTAVFFGTASVYYRGIG
jgi:hypothetical protein